MKLSEVDNSAIHEPIYRSKEMEEVAHLPNNYEKELWGNIALFIEFYLQIKAIRK